MHTRRQRRLIAGAATLTAALLQPAAAPGAEIVAELQANRIYFGTQTLLIVDVVDVPSSEWPTVEPVKGLRIERYRSPRVAQDLISRRITRSYRFIITPDSKGVFQIPAVSLEAGGTVLKSRPLALEVIQAPFKFRAARVEPTQVLVGEPATLVISYQGVRPGVKPAVPAIAGLSIRPAQPPRVEVTRREGLPITTYAFKVTAAKLGSYRISGISVDGVAADPVALAVSPFVVERTQVGQSSLVVGEHTMVHVLIRGLPKSTRLKLITPAGLKAVQSRQQYRDRSGATVFSFDVTATEPGDFNIGEVGLPDRRKLGLGKPIKLSVRQAGAGGIFACRGTPRSDETVIGDSFIVDYEVFFRGELRGAAIDLSRASFTKKGYVTVEPVNDLAYPNWPGQPIEVACGQGRVTMLSGSGEFNGQKEQLLRFALKITPLAAGELALDGLRVALLLQIREERRTAFSSITSSQTKQFDRIAEVPPHQVIDPPGITAPAGYRGAVGTAFTFVTELDREKATAMSPLTLTMKITGESVGPTFVPPPLAEVAELTRDFDVSSTVSGGEVTDDTIAFTQVVRPRSESVTELPALPLVYYDYEKKEYETVYSLPIPLQVTPGSLVGAATMEVVDGQEAPAPDQAAAEGERDAPVLLGANHTDLGQVVVGEPLGVVEVLVILIGGPVCIALARAGRQLYRKRRPLAAVRQQRKSLLSSLDRLSGADDFFVELADLLQSYLRLTFGLPPGELSSGTLTQAFDDRSLDGPLRQEAEALLQVCDAGRFATGSVSGEEKARLIRRARQLFKELDRGVK